MYTLIKQVAFFVRLSVLMGGSTNRQDTGSHNGGEKHIKLCLACMHFTLRMSGGHLLMIVTAHTSRN